MHSAAAGHSDDDASGRDESFELQTAFTLAKFIPLLQERIHVLNPYTRSFLVSWVTLLDSIPDLELVTYLPTFLSGLFKFLSDPNQDVHTATRVALDRFLSEIKKIARIKRGIAESRRSPDDDGHKRSDSVSSSGRSESVDAFPKNGETSNHHAVGGDDAQDQDESDAESNVTDDDKSTGNEEDWIPGQDVQVDHAKILDILVTFLSDSSGQSDRTLSEN